MRARNMLSEDAFAYARPFHPLSSDYNADRFGGFNSLLQRVLDDSLFIVPRQMPGGRTSFEVWAITDRYAIPPAATRFHVHVDPVTGGTAELGPKIIQNLLHSRKDLWHDKASREAELDRLTREWDGARADAGKERLVEACGELAEVHDHYQRAPVHSGGGTA